MIAVERASFTGDHILHPLGGGDLHCRSRQGARLYSKRADRSSIIFRSAHFMKCHLWKRCIRNTSVIIQNEFGNNPQPQVSQKTGENRKVINTDAQTIGSFASLGRRLFDVLYLEGGVPSPVIVTVLVGLTEFHFETHPACE